MALQLSVKFSNTKSDQNRRIRSRTVSCVRTDCTYNLQVLRRAAYGLLAVRGHQSSRTSLSAYEQFRNIKDVQTRTKESLGQGSGGLITTPSFSPCEDIVRRHRSLLLSYCPCSPISGLSSTLTDPLNPIQRSGRTTMRVQSTLQILAVQHSEEGSSSK